MNIRFWVAFCVIGVLILSGCGTSKPKIVNLTISGTLFGEVLPDTSTGRITTGPIPGSISCNNHTIVTNDDGTFSLEIPKVPQIQCTVSASQNYVTQTFDVS